MAVALALLAAMSALSSCTSPATAELTRLEHPVVDGAPLRLLVVGDWGRKGGYNQTRVAEQMGKVAEETEIDFVVSTGDNFLENGLAGVDDMAFHDSFMDVYTAKSLHKPWYLGIVDFFFVDTTPFQLQYWTDPGEDHYDWRGVAPRDAYIANLLEDVDAAMKKSTATWKIAVGHHTMRSVSAHGDTQELLELLLPVLKENGVDFYINGHDHCLEHISSRDSPIQYFTSGGGSKAWRGIFQQNEDKLQFFYDGQGFLSLELSENRARFAFYDVFGEALYHWSFSKANLQKVQSSASVTEE
uniref:Purple acid phosphatase n=1 Tax=Oryza meridionalis TaxID=40149 RepID=A0A0E0EVE0_9ORYZ